MTASQTLNLLVDKDGSAEVVLLPPTEKVTKKRTRSKISSKLVVLLMVLSLCATCLVVPFLFLQYRRDQVKDQYQIYLHINGQDTLGTLQFNYDSQTEVVKCGLDDLRYPTSMSDGLNELTAVKIQAADMTSICLIRNDKMYGLSSPPILPRVELMGAIMNETNRDKVRVVMSEVEWVQEESLRLDPSSLSPAVQSFCDGLPIYEMRPLGKETIPFTGDYNDGKVDDEIFFDDIDLSIAASGADMEMGDDETIDDGVYSLQTDGEEFKRVPRGISPEANISQAAGEEAGGANAQSGTDDLNLGEGESDHDLGCCNHCDRGYLSCSKVCVPLETRTYPYFYRNCDHVQCQLYLPCRWWRARGYMGV